MATLTRRLRGGNLNFEIQFYESGKRKTIPLGRKFTEKTATELLEVVEVLVHCKANGIDYPGRKTVQWIENASPVIQDKLAKAGLIETVHRKTAGELWSEFLGQKKDIKEATRDGYDYVEQRFFAFFDRETDLRDLTPERFVEWKDFLQTDYRSPRTKKPLIESTVAGTISKIKAVFNWAKAKKWIAESPLDGVGRGSFVNDENDRHITMDEYFQLLDACPCSDWRAIIALARVGGLRAPSEVLRLRWEDVNWAKNRFYVRSPKTERYKGKSSRLVPLFPWLRVELERLFEMETSIGQEFVITRYRDPERTNLGTQFARIVKMAGVEEIPHPFNNMRASRSTEVYAEFGAFLESKWIGHSAKIARDHYLQVREEDFDRAVGYGSSGNDFSCCPKSGFPAAEKKVPAIFPAVVHRNESQGVASGK